MAETSKSARRVTRVLVCGGRDYQDRGFVALTLARLWRECAGVLHIIQGGAEGADALAREWALSERLPVTTYPANWIQHGRSAGPIRNQQMLDEGQPDLVVAFPGGRGTADMVRRARAVGLPIAEYAASPSQSERTAPSSPTPPVPEGDDHRESQ